KQVRRAAAAETVQARLPAGREAAGGEALLRRAPERLAPVQDVDRTLHVLVLVRRITPCEAGGVLPSGVEDQQQVREVGGESTAVRDVHLHAAARPPGVLLERGREVGGAEPHAPQALGIEVAGE